MQSSMHEMPSLVEHERPPREPVFPVSQPVIEEAVCSLTNFPPYQFYQASVNDLYRTHPQLQGYMDEVLQETPEPERKSYVKSALLTYRIIHDDLSAKQQDVTLTEQDIQLHKHNKAEQGITNGNIWQSSRDLVMQLEDTSANNPLSEFMGRVRSSSEAMYFLYLEAFRSGALTSAQSKRCLEGMYDVFMPFYRKFEAEYLHDHLVLFPTLQAAFDAGYYKRG